MVFSKPEMISKKNTYDADDLGPNIKLNMNRCILCARCVLVVNQLTNTREHGILFRGEHAEISTYLNKALDNDFIGNVIDVCPVGALTDRTARFPSRVWFTKPVDATCTCSKCSGKSSSLDERRRNRKSNCQKRPIRRSRRIYLQRM